MGLKGGHGWRCFRQENFKNTNFPKTLQSPLGHLGKFLGRANFYIEIFFPESEFFLFKCGLLGVKVGNFSSEVGHRSRGQPEKPEIDDGVPRFFGRARIWAQLAALIKTCHHNHPPTPLSCQKVTRGSNGGWVWVAASPRGARGGT